MVAIVVMPSVVAFGVTIGGPFWLLLLCKSPLNALFAYLFQTMLVIQAALALLVLLPVLVRVAPTLLSCCQRHCADLRVDCSWACTGTKRLRSRLRAAAPAWLEWREEVMGYSVAADTPGEICRLRK